jgi:hypothetical protein
MTSMLSKARSNRELLEANRRFCDVLWTDARLIEPERFNQSPLVRSFISQSRRWLDERLRALVPIDSSVFNLLLARTAD